MYSGYAEQNTYNGSFSDKISEEILEYWNLRERHEDWLDEQEEWDNEDDDENK